MPIKTYMSFRNAWFLLFLVMVFLFIFAESNYIQNKNILFIKASLSQLIVASLGLALMLWALPSKSRLKWLHFSLLVIKSLLIFIILFMVFTEAAMVDFSGMLFGPEAIVHFSWDAFVLGVNEYLWLFCALLLFFALAVFVLVYSSQAWLSNRAQWWVFLSSLVLLSVAFDHTVLARYTKGIKRYMDLNQLQDVSEKQLKKLEPLGISKLVVSKAAITASSGNNKNLIVIYLESFSDLFTTSNQYPDLTPNINRLKSEYVALHPYVSTASFTMDGLIGSLCGFLPNMTLGNNALTESEKHYYSIPCMTDVLKQAGYHQEFVGGAKKSFANKGTFLLDHGYDLVFGWEDFANKTTDYVPLSRNWWGLNDDDLFNFAASRIKALKNRAKPFHITVLTLSTHLKGFLAPTCQPFAVGADKFIDAIHCTDQLLGQFINQLETDGLLNETVVFITGDHRVFNTSLTKELFGENISSQNLLGLIIDKTPQNNNIPMGLYDMAPVLLDRLEINHNVTFINGQSNVFSTDRLLLTRNQVFQNGQPIKLNPVCDKDDELDAAMLITGKLSICTHKKSINTLHGYTQLFKLDKSLKYHAGSSLKVTFSEDSTQIEEIALNGKSIKTQFSRDGFKLNGESFNSLDIFYIQFDPNHKTITKTFLLNGSANPFDIINYLNNQADLPFIVFGIQHALNAEFKQHLKRYNQSACLNDQFCFYKPEVLGQLQQNAEHTEVSLLFNR